MPIFNTHLDYWALVTYMGVLLLQILWLQLSKRWSLLTWALEDPVWKSRSL